MKNIFLIFTLLISFTACAQEQKNNVSIALCEKGKGCKEIVSSKAEIAVFLRRANLVATATEKFIVVIEKCNFKKETKLTLAQLHQSYGGKGEPQKIKNFDFEKYLTDNGCLSNCTNSTKKFDFHINTSGEDAISGNGYFYLNLKAGEAFMPNEAFQQFYGSEAKGMILDQFLRNGAMENFTIAEGQKFRTKMPIGTNMSVIKNDALNEQRFKTDFKKTGNTRKHLNTTAIETEYKGKDDEGKIMNFWITPVADVCLPNGKFDAFGFYNLGYISVDGTTYLVTEISGSGFEIKLTGISDGSYNFNPAGYKSY